MEKLRWVSWSIAVAVGLLPQFSLAQQWLGSQSETSYGGVHSQPFDVNPKAGIFSYDARDGEGRSSPIAGFGLEWNASEQMGTQSPIYYGGSTGLSYTGIESQTQDSALLQAPLNALLGYHLTDNILVAAHGGLKLFYQNDPSVLNVGDGTNNFELFTNAGLNGSYSLSNALAITAELDWTFTDRSDPFMGTVGVAIPVG